MPFKIEHRETPHIIPVKIFFKKYKTIFAFSSMSQHWDAVEIFPPWRSVRDPCIPRIKYYGDQGEVQSQGINSLGCDLDHGT